VAAPRGRPQNTRTGTLLVVVGIVGVLSVTFIAGVWTGHHWPVLFGHARPPAAAEPASAATTKGRSTTAERPRSADTLPALTFYHDLTAPLTAPPPGPRPSRTPRPTEPRRDDASKPGQASPPAGASARAELPPAAEAAGRFTIQVAAYNARQPAEALRATLAAAGHEARVVEADSGSGVRYRVQVGTFPSKDVAREAAVRLAAERSLSTFVTAR
jgi:cell division protein FtsN